MRTDRQPFTAVGDRRDQILSNTLMLRRVKDGSDLRGLLRESQAWSREWKCATDSLEWRETEAQGLRGGCLEITTHDSACNTLLRDFAFIDTTIAPVFLQTTSHLSIG